MKKTLLLLFFILLTNANANITFTVGSNYYLTTRAFPHDLLKWPKKAVFLNYTPQSFPWQGDVTNIFNRPSESYVNSYQSIEFAVPYGYTGNPEDIRSWMNVSGYISNQTYSVGGLFTTPFGRLYAELGRSTMEMDLEAKGTARADEETGGSTQYFMVPFEGQTAASREEYDLKIIYANSLFNNPFGLKFRLRSKTADLPKGFTKYTKEGIPFSTPHLTWGWAANPCNHIFGYDHINADAFYLNDYTLYNGTQTDMQASYEINGNYKTAIRYRRERSDGEVYDWLYEDGSDVTGDYYPNEYWKYRKSGDLHRTYSKVNFWQTGGLTAGILFFLQHDSRNQTLVNKVTDSDPGWEKREREFVIETNPYFNFKFKRGYSDFGILLEYSFQNMSNVSTRWNSASKSDQKNVLWNTTPYNGWSYPWENFSNGNQSFFATGFESYTSVNIHRNTSFIGRLFVMRKYTTVNKFYGQSEINANSSSYEFEQTHHRRSSKNETWMTGSFGVHYKTGPTELFLTLNFPLAYLISQKTSLDEGSENLFNHDKRNMWQVQQPIYFQLFMIYSLGN